MDAEFFQPAIKELYQRLGDKAHWICDVAGLRLPFKHPGKNAEEKIISLIQEGRTKRAHSKSLLERAKRAIEIAIEQSEETALAYPDGKRYLADELLPKLFSPNRHYLDLATVQRIFENLSTRYRLNIGALKRYAERRKTDSTELFKLSGTIRHRP